MKILSFATVAFITMANGALGKFLRSSSPDLDAGISLRQVLGTTAPVESTPAPSPGPTPWPTGSTPAPSPGTPGPTAGTPWPTGSTPVPSLVTPVPTAGTPGPTGATPAPSLTTPGPTGSTPGPTGTTPAPSSSTPGPTAGSTPGPTGSTPAPSSSTPAPSGSTPAPTGSTPSPSSSTPAPTGSTPAPTARTPVPTGSTPAPTANYTMPSEEEPHEGTWLQWPHNFGWDPQHVERYEESWIQMTQALHGGERVHIIVYSIAERGRVRRLLRDRGLNMDQIDFFKYRTNDVWARDTGPIFVYDENNNLIIQNWGFNGWGGKQEFNYDNEIPRKVARDLNMVRVDVNLVNEGGSVEIDGQGTLMAKRSSIINPNRNPGLNQEQIEAVFRQYLGIERFIWMDGVIGEEITDDHIDGTARFAGTNTIVANEPNFLREGELEILQNARTAEGQPYNIVHLPVSDKVVGQFNGVYINYYVGNDVVLVPIYNDPRDNEAIGILQGIYAPRRVVGINMEELYKDGGACHCVTQQQPMPRRR